MSSLSQHCGGGSGGYGRNVRAGAQLWTDRRRNCFCHIHPGADCGAFGRCRQNGAIIIRCCGQRACPIGPDVFYFSRILFTIPLNKMRKQTKIIASGGDHLGEQLPLNFPGEWNELASDVNSMSSKLKDMYDGLELRVQERTAELQQALKEVKQLSGLLPICANCKKVRDDSGYWQQIEQYIAAHSEADFSHSICPECMKRLYPELYEDKQ